MLSKLALLLLGFIAERPLNPYEIKKLFAHLYIDRWFPIGSSSIYAAMKSLVKRNYIVGEKVKSGNMPEKTIYSITSKGKDALHHTLQSYLQEPEQNFSEFNVAIVFLCHLPKQTAMQALRAHHDYLNKDIDGKERHYKAKQAEHAPYLALISLKHIIYKREAERKIIEDLLKQMEVDEEWNHFPALCE